MGSDTHWLLNSKPGQRAIAPTTTLDERRRRFRALVLEVENIPSVTIDEKALSASMGGCIDFRAVSQGVDGRTWTHELQMTGPLVYGVCEYLGKLKTRIRDE